MVSEALIGVFLGGVLAGLPAWIQLYQQGKQWQLEKRIEHKKKAIEHLMRVYGEASSNMIHGLSNPSFKATSSAKVTVYGSREARDIYTAYFAAPPAGNEVNAVAEARQRFETAAYCHLHQLEKDLDELLR